MRSLGIIAILSAAPVLMAQSLAGLWQATVNVNGIEVPFRIEFRRRGQRQGVAVQRRRKIHVYQRAVLERIAGAEVGLHGVAVRSDAGRRRARREISPAERRHLRFSCDARSKGAAG